MVIDEHNLPLGDQAIVGIQSRWIMDGGIELDNSASTHLEQLVNWHHGLTQNDR